MSITHLYKDFKTSSYDKYRNVVRDLNISFVKLGHEECEICEGFLLHDDTHDKNNINNDCVCCQNWVGHMKKAKQDSRL